MTTFARGDVVLVPFGFTSGAGAKWRPALVLSTSAYNSATPDTIVASITSNLRAVPHPGDHLLIDWQAAGQLRPSLAQTKLATVLTANIGRRLGGVTLADLAAVDAGLQVAMGLP